MSASGVFAADTITSPADLEKLFNENFYESPMGITMPNVEVVEGSNIKPVRGMPLFKKTRIKVTNYLREKDYKKTLELIEKEKQEQARLEAEENAKLNNELNINYVEPVNDNEKVSKKDRKGKKDKEEVTSNSDTTLELEGGVKQQVTSNDVVCGC